MQIPKKAHKQFFRGRTGLLRVRVYNPPTTQTPLLVQLALAYYARSDTYRINRLLELGLLGHACILIQESISPDAHYEMWWFEDPHATRLLKRPYDWTQARSSQHGPGRFWTVLEEPGPRRIS